MSTPLLKPLEWLPAVPANLSQIAPYRTGEPSSPEVTDLSNNENPLGPSPAAVRAARLSLGSMHRYPDTTHAGLRACLARSLGCDSNEIAIGNGSTELIEQLFRVFVADSQASAITHETAFIFYKLCARAQGRELVEARDGPGYKPDVGQLLRALKPSTRLALLALPNNPTGGYIGREEVDELARELDTRHVILVLDYAYWEYVTARDLPDPMQVYRQHPNVVILRTFSKIYGLAGARVGYLIARPALASLVDRSRQPFNVSSSALAAAMAALEDRHHVQRSFELNRAGIKRVTQALKSGGFEVLPSQGNFVCVNFGRLCQELQPLFLRQGLRVRPLTIYGLDTFFRITIGTEEENEKFLKVVNLFF